MSVFEQHKAALAAIIASQEVTDAFPLDHEICSRLAALTDPRGSKPLAELEPSSARTVLRLSTTSGIDKVAVVEGGSARTIEVTDVVTFDDELSPLQNLLLTAYLMQLVEFRFAADDAWRVSNVCEDTLGFLKQTKHKAWRDGMLSIYGGCAKAFIPSLKQGLITHMYDHMMFADNSPAGEAYVVTNEKGDKVFIPHPVYEFRVWDSSTATYKNVSAHLDGVPETTESQQQYWQEFLAELRRVTSEKYGPEFIDDCLSLEVDAVKEKYGS